MQDRNRWLARDLQKIPAPRGTLNWKWIVCSDNRRAVRPRLQLVVFSSFAFNPFRHRHGYGDRGAFRSLSLPRRIHRHTSRERGHQSVIERDAFDLFGQPSVWRGSGLIRQIGDFHSRPDARQTLVCRGGVVQVGGHCEFKLLARDCARNANLRFAVALKASSKNYRAAYKKVGHFARKNFAHIHPAPVNCDVRQAGMTDALKKVFHYLGRFVTRAEIRDGAATRFGHVIHQITIHRRTDAETENTRSTKSFMDFAQNFRFVANVAVGEKTNEAQPLWVVREIERGFDALDHLSWTVAVQRAQIVQAALRIFRGGFERSRAKLRCARREIDDLKRVARSQQAQSARDCSLGLFDGPSIHAAGAVEHEYQLQRLASEVHQFPGRIKHQREITTALIALRQQIRFDLFAGDAVTQNEIAVRKAVFWSEHDDQLIARRGFMRHVVSRATKLFDGHTGVHFPLQRNVVSAPLAGFHVLNFGFLTGSAGVSAGRRADAVGHARRIESRADDHRENKFIPAVHIFERVKVFDRHVNLLARLDVRGGVRENVWSFF